MKFIRTDGINGNGDYFVRYQLTGRNALSPRKIEIYVTRHSVEVDEFDYSFTDVMELRQVAALLSQAFFHHLTLKNDRPVMKSGEPDCVEMGETE